MHILNSCIIQKTHIAAMVVQKTESFHHGVEIFHAVNRIAGLIVIADRQKKRSDPLFLFAQTENLNFAKQNNSAFGFGKLGKSEEPATKNINFQKLKIIGIVSSKKSQYRKTILDQLRKITIIKN